MPFGDGNPQPSGNPIRGFLWLVVIIIGLTILFGICDPLGQNWEW